MTRKDYVAIAAAFAKSGTVAFTGAPLTGAALAQWQYDIACIADVFAADNARFDRARFIAACGIQ